MNEEVEEYRLAKAIPNKILNSDGTYSTMQDVIGRRWRKF